MTPVRFEHEITLLHCRAPCELRGNLSLRDASGPATRLAYECAVCHKQIQVVDGWDEPDADQLAAIDETP